MTNPTGAAKPAATPAKTGPATPGAPAKPGAATPAKPGSADQRSDQIRDQVLALDVKRVADWIGALVRTIKASRTYPANSPTLHKFQVELESRTWSSLKEVGDITLVIQQFDLLYENYSVYHNADRNESLAFRFYGDGVREITFREGLEPHELRGFLEVLRRSVDSAQVQDDVVTLLWERDFRHIQYLFISLEDLTEESGQVPYDADEEFGRARGRLGHSLADPRRGRGRAASRGDGRGIDRAVG